MHRQRSVHALRWLASARRTGIPRTRTAERQSGKRPWYDGMAAKTGHPGRTCTATLRFVKAALLCLSYRASSGESSESRPRNLPGKNRVLCLLSYRSVLWGEQPGLNRHRPRSRRGALPLSYAHHCLVWADGFKPTTSRFQTGGSDQAELYPGCLVDQE